MINFYDMFSINQSDVIKMFSTITRPFWNDWIVATCPVKYHKIMRDFSITDQMLLNGFCSMNTCVSYRINSQILSQGNLRMEFNQPIKTVYMTRAVVWFCLSYSSQRWMRVQVKTKRLKKVTWHDLKLNVARC